MQHQIALSAVEKPLIFIFCDKERIKNLLRREGLLTTEKLSELLSIWD